MAKQPTSTVAAIYARVSTQDQNNDLQLTDLRAYAARQGWRVYEYQEKESSVKKRPVFLQMLDDAKAGKVNVILVWRIDRFARSMKDFVMTTLQLNDWRVRLISVTESVDTGDNNPFAEFQRGLLALLAQLERKIIVARVNAGVAQYKADYAAGRIGKDKHSKSGKDLAAGRPKKIFRRDEMIKLRRKGLSIRAIGSELGIAHTTVADALKGIKLK
jgi:DNA invertase Pin-like site-specific DNA recombinase